MSNRRDCRTNPIVIRLIPALVWSMVILSILLPSGALVQPAGATRLAPDLTKTIERKFDGAKIRLDGSVETSGHLYLPLVPVPPKGAAAATAKKEPSKVEVESTYPEGLKHPDIVFYNNGWAHILLLRKGDACTPAVHANMHESLRKRLAAVKFPSDLIVPQGFVVPRSYKHFIQDVPTISSADDNVVFNPDFGEKKRPTRENYKGTGTVFLTSITSGSITMLDAKTLHKIAEFPTEGTPCSIELINGMIYITDQGKSRVLIVDPVTRKFHGQIDLPPKSAPKGICALPNGKLMYVSESAIGTVACIETGSGKPLVTTKTHPGPGRMAMTPDGIFVVVLTVTSGEVTIISTYNQAVVSNFKVGDMPTSIVISNDSKLAYVSCRLSNHVAVIDIPGRRVVHTIKTGVYPTGLALSPDNSKLYVSCAKENLVTAYDTKTLLKLIDAHTPPEVEFPGFLCMLPDGKRLLLCSQQSDALAVLDTETMQFEKPMSLGHAMHEAAWEPVP